MLCRAGAGIMGKPPELGLNHADSTSQPPLTECPSRASEPILLPSHLWIHLQTGSDLGQSPGTRLEQTHRIGYLQVLGCRGLRYSTQDHCLHHHHHNKLKTTLSNFLCSQLIYTKSRPGRLGGNQDPSEAVPGTPLAWTSKSISFCQ